MKRLASSLLVSTGLLVLMLTFSASNTQAGGAPSMSTTAEPSATTAAEDHVVLERRFAFDPRTVYAGTGRSYQSSIP